jgi:hypothetical protein
MVLLVTACASIQWQKNEALYQAVTEAIVARVLTEHPGWVDATYRIAGEAKAAAETGRLVTVQALTEYTVSLIPLKDLQPEEQTLVKALVGQVAQGLADRFEAQGIENPSDQLVQAAAVLGWIQDVAARRRP